MIRRVLPILAFAGLTACGSTPPPQTFPPLDYSYLPPITLRVSTVNVTNAYVPDPGAATLLGQDPEPPANALLQVLNQRLLPSGAPGTASATIETASIDQIGSNLTGTLTVQLNVATPDGRHTGYTEASVTHTDPAPDPTSSYNQVQAALYQLTKELMDQMNTQLQYQIQHNLSVWVVGGAGFNPSASSSPGGPVTGGGIQAAPLAPPSPNAPGTPTNTLPGGTSPTAIPPGPPIQLAPEGPSPTPTPPTTGTPTAIPPAPTAPTAPAAPAAPAAPTAQAAPTPPAVYNPNAGPGM